MYSEKQESGIVGLVADGVEFDEWRESFGSCALISCVLVMSGACRFVRMWLWRVVVEAGVTSLGGERAFEAVECGWGG